MWYVILILFTHFIADFVLQSRKIGNNKHKSTVAVMQHAALYASILWCVLLLFAPLDKHYFKIVSSTTMLEIFILVNGILHFITDWFTSRITHYFYQFTWGEKKFWVTIGLDQFIHTATLIISAYYLLGVKF